MKILIFNWQDIKNPLSGGAEVHLHEIFSRIAQLGHDVTLYCSSFKGAKREENIGGIRVIREGGRYLFNFRVVYKYLTTFRKGKYDIVVDDMNKIPFLTPLYVREPLFFIIHHLFNKSIFLEVPLPMAVYVFLMEKFGIFICKKMRVPVIVVSPSTKAEMIEKGIESQNIYFAYNCVNHKLYKPVENNRSSTKLIGYFGRIKKYKSIEHLLQAVAIVIKEHPDLKLVIIGDGDNKINLQNLSNKLEIEKNVEFTGFVDDVTKVNLLQQMWFLVNTSSKEGWGLTVIEANACKTLVIASNVPGLKDSVKDGETGLLYEYGNIPELALKIKLLLNDNRLRDKLSANAYRWAQTFDWDATARTTVELLKTKLGKK